MEKKCIVKGCENYHGQGTFIGDLCAPCHEMITTGIIHHCNITFIGDMARKYKRDKERLDWLEHSLFLNKQE